MAIHKGSIGRGWPESFLRDGTKSLEVPCFWCGRMMSPQQKTRDHLISKPLRRFLCQQRDTAQLCHVNRTKTVPACGNCNQKRSMISMAFKAWTVANRQKDLSDSLKRRSVFLKQRSYALPLIDGIRALIIDKLSKELAELLLIETDAVSKEPEEWPDETVFL